MGKLKKLPRDRRLLNSCTRRATMKKFKKELTLRFNRFTVLLLLNFFIQCSHCSDIRCLENGRFYRNPDNPSRDIYTEEECSKYFLCLEGEVYEFQCTSGLLFDVIRQICDFKPNVENCELITEPVVPRPLLDKAKCEDPNYLGCANGTCIPDHYFCDGSIDCLDGSDEGHCGNKIDPFSAQECDPNNCALPDCFCSKDGTNIPGNLKATQIPQMILISFEDAVNFDNWDLYTRILFTPEIQNPNGCPIKATFFVSHMYNNYQQTQKLWNHGHEIALHSITHRGPENWWSNATLIDYFDELVGQANILHKFANIKLKDIKGSRMPYLKTGGNKQYLMMKEFGFLYDSSLVAPLGDPPLWPYTLDFKIPYNCSEEEQSCPTRSYPGLWEMILNKLISNKFTCATLDNCPKDLKIDEMYRLLVHNFKRHYLTNRAPFGLNFQSNWFKNADYLIAFQKFLEHMMQYPDVWFVTHTQAINWMRQPTTLGRLKSFNAWSCNRQLRPSDIACEKPNVCKLHSRVFQQQRLLYTCAECPDKYPWIGNEFGNELIN